MIKRVNLGGNSLQKGLNIVITLLQERMHFVGNILKKRANHFLKMC